MSVPKRVKELIKYLDLSQAEFGREIGYRQQNINYIISKGGLPSTEFFQRVAERYDNVSIEYLISGRGELIRKEQDVSINKSNIISGNENSVAGKNISVGSDDKYKILYEAKVNEVELLKDQINILKEYIESLKSK